MKEKYRLLVNHEQFLTRLAIMSEKKIEYLFVTRNDVPTGVGNIYKGKIERVISGLNAAFVNIGESRNGFLPFGKDEPLYRTPESEEKDSGQVKKHHRTGEEIIVQISKPGTSEKGMKLTTKVSLPGRFLILIPDSSLRTLSKKITDRKERGRLFDIVDRRIFDNTGFIIRTAAEGKNEGYLLRELKILQSTWNRIKRHAKARNAPSVLWKELPIFINVLRDYVTSDYKEILVDDEKAYGEVRRYANLFLPEMRGKVSIYKEKLPLFVKYGLEKEIENFLSKKIPLPSGGSLIIEEGETLNAIDVNSGSSDRTNFKETVLHTNVEAAKEIPRQIRARNLSGLIVVDFIDMKRPHERRKVFRTLSDNLEFDKAQTKILSISKLGIVEMSREKTDFKLSDMLLDRCERCRGTGYIKNVFFIALKFKNELFTKVARNPHGRFTAEISRDLYEFITRNKSMHDTLIKHRIHLRENTSFRESEFKITD